MFQDGFLNERKSYARHTETFNKSHRETTQQLCPLLQQKTGVIGIFQRNNPEIYREDTQTRGDLRGRVFKQAVVRVEHLLR